jgi:hypothetical protein
MISKVLLLEESDIAKCLANQYHMWNCGIGVCVDSAYASVFPHLTPIDVHQDGNGTVIWDSRIPQAISPRQGMILLDRMGNLHQVEQTVYNLAIITGDEQVGKEAVITWEKATAWTRNDATVLFIANLLQWTNEMIDDFFVNASKIV